MGAHTHNTATRDIVSTFYNQDSVSKRIEEFSEKVDRWVLFAEGARDRQVLENLKMHGVHDALSKDTSGEARDLRTFLLGVWGHEFGTMTEVPKEIAFWAKIGYVQINTVESGVPGVYNHAFSIKGIGEKLAEKLHNEEIERRQDSKGDLGPKRE